MEPAARGVDQPEAQQRQHLGRAVHGHGEAGRRGREPGHPRRGHRELGAAQGRGADDRHGQVADDDQRAPHGGGQEAYARLVRLAPAEQRRVLDRFIAACTAGDLDGLLAVLDPDVDGPAEVGGTVGRRVASGAPTVAALVLRYLGPATGTALLALPGLGDEAVLVGRRDGRVVLLASLTVRAGRIAHVEGIADPAVLAWISASRSGPTGGAA